MYIISVSQQAVICNALTHYNLYSVSLAVAKCWNNIALDGIAINYNALNALVDVIRVRNLDVVCSTTELTSSCHSIPCSRYRWINLQTIEVC